MMGRVAGNRPPRPSPAPPMKQKFLLVASIAVGLLAAILARAWVNARNAEVDARVARIKASQATVQVLYAARPLAAGTKLEMSDLAAGETLQVAVGSDNISALDAHRVVGRTLNHTVSAEDPLLWTYLEGGRDTVRKLSEDVSSGLRAISIPVSGAAAVSGLVRPSDHVDVLATFATGLDKENPELVTMTVVQNVTVLATGAETSRTRSSAAAGSYGTVTLLVSPREAEVLVFAQQMRGSLFLTLRHPRDVHYESELPRVDFSKIESELKALNEERQKSTRRPPASR